MLKISDIEPFAVGNSRACYVHPDDDSKCIKLLHDESTKPEIRTTGGFVRSIVRKNYDANMDEYVSLKKIEKKVGSKYCEHISKVYGFEDTDKGMGLVLGLIRDVDGKISRSLRGLAVDGVKYEQIEDALNEFFTFLMDNRIVTRRLIDHNLIAQKTESGKWKIYLIDGFGDPAFIPAAQWIGFLAKMKIEKRIKMATANFKKLFEGSGSPETVEILKKQQWGLIKNENDPSTD